MKVLGAFSMVFGILLIVGAIVSFSVQNQYSFSTHVIVTIALLISGICVLLFVSRTIAHKYIAVKKFSAENILDLPEYIFDEGKSKTLSSFTISCGYAALISSLSYFTYCIYITYFIVSRFAAFANNNNEIGFIILAFTFICAVMLFIYCTRKLFFSSK